MLYFNRDYIFSLKINNTFNIFLTRKRNKPKLNKLYTWFIRIRQMLRYMSGFTLVQNKQLYKFWLGLMHNTCKKEKI